MLTCQNDLVSLQRGDASVHCHTRLEQPRCPPSAAKPLLSRGHSDEGGREGGEREGGREGGREREGVTNLLNRQDIIRRVLLLLYPW